MATTIREEVIDAVKFGNSYYLLLDATMKEILSQELKEKFVLEKHRIKVQVSMNKKGQKFVAFWFVDAKKK